MFRFLLRFFAVFIACSAFVGLASRPVLSLEIGDQQCDDGTGTCGTIGLEASASCDNPPLLWHGNSNNYGTYTLTAQYTPIDYSVKYVAGSCHSESNAYVARTDMHYVGSENEEYKPVLDIGQNSPTGVVLPSQGNWVFNGWYGCWYDCDNLDTVLCNENNKDMQVDAGDTVQWSKPKCLLLSGICENVQCTSGQYFNGTNCQSCPSGYNYSDNGATSITQCYKIETVNCQPQQQDLPEHCISQNAVWENSCDCTETVTYRIYSNAEGTGEGQHTDANGEPLPQDKTAPEAPTCDLQLLSTTGALGYYNYDTQSRDCSPIMYKLEYNCGKKPDSDEDVGGTPPEATNNIEINSSVEVKDYTDGQCQSAKLDFQYWSCVKKEHESPYSTVGNAKNYNAGAEINPWQAYDMECTAVWDYKKYTVTYNVMLGNTIYSTKGGTNSSDISWPEGNPDKYISITNVTLENPTSSYQPGTAANYIIMPGKWYECGDENKTPVTQIAGNFAQNPRNLNLCIEAGWPITYIACYNSLSNCEETDDDHEDVTSLVCDPYNKMYYRPGHDVTLPNSVSGDCRNRIDVSSSSGVIKWYKKVSSSSLQRITDTVGQSGVLKVYAMLAKEYRVTYDCNPDELYGPAPSDDTLYSEGSTVTTKTGCKDRDGYIFKWSCDEISDELVPGAAFQIVRNTKCVAHWICDTANGYVSEGGQCESAFFKLTAQTA